MWHPKSWTSESGIQHKDSPGVPLTIGIPFPTFTGWNPELTAWNPKSKTLKTVLNNLTWGDRINSRLSFSFFSRQTLGNHEFDDGVQNLVSFISHLNFPVVASNLNFTQEPLLSSTPPLIVTSKVLNVSGERIGFVGYVKRGSTL